MTVSTNEELQAICQVIKETVNAEQIYLFGSHAYGTPRDDGDYDLYVVVPDGEERTIDVTIAIRKALFSVPRKPLDVIVSHKSRFLQRKQGPTLERTVVNNGILLYEQKGMAFNGQLRLRKPEMCSRLDKKEA